MIPKYETLWETLIKQAEACKASPKQKPVFYPNYFSCFKHYPSSILNERTLISLTEEGMRFMKTRKLTAGIASSNLIVPQVVFLTLFYLKERKNSNIGKIGSYIRELFKEVSSDNINYHVMWMLKYNFVEVVF
jgi:hypothetical protein